MALTSKVRDFQVMVDCVNCGKAHTLFVNSDDYNSFKTGTLMVQHAFPYLGAPERELFISRMCGLCWDQLMEEDV